MSFIEKAVPLGTSDQDIYVCPTTQSGSMHGLVLSNIGALPETFQLKLYSQTSGTITPITPSATSIAAGALFVWPKPINMVAGDRVIASASSAGAIVALASVYIAAANPVSSGFNPRGAWSASATYNVNDVVSCDGNSYIAVAQSVNSAPPNSNWMTSAQKGDIGFVAKGTWSGATAYNPNEVVMSPVDHNLYIALQGALGNEPSTSPIYWGLLLQNDSVGAATASASAAAASATSAATSATTATTQAGNAASSATAASSSASTAATAATAAAASQASAIASASSATASASSATSSASTATTQASNASASAASAATSATNANASMSLASQWADADQNVQVVSGKYSAKHWALAAQATVTGALIYRGSWDASVGSYPAAPGLGDYYKISVAGSMGAVSYNIGDSMIYNGIDWDKIDSTDQVTTVAGRQGAVVLTKSDVGLNNVDDTSDANKPVSTAQATALGLKQDLSAKDASNGYAGLTLFGLNLRNVANTITSWFTNSNTVARTYTLPDKDGTVAMLSDITGTNSGTNTGDETDVTIKSKLGITTLSGSNTGDQTTVSGNAGTATTLQTARTIDGQSFDGSANITVIAPGTHAATSKTTPVDADEFAVADSDASFGLKKSTWANIKTTLQAYFDTLYQAAGSYAALAGSATQSFSMTTAAVDTNTTQGATTAFVLGQAGTSNPTMNGTAAVGTSTLFARQDHIHASDTSLAPLASPTFTGTVAMPLYSETLNARGSISGAQTIDLTLGTYVTATITAATTFTFSNPVATGKSCGFVLELTNGGAGAITWPAGIKWPGGTAPTLTASGVDLLLFITRDGGATWRAVQGQKDSK